MCTGCIIGVPTKINEHSNCVSDKNISKTKTRGVEFGGQKKNHRNRWKTDGTNESHLSQINFIHFVFLQFIVNRYLK